MEQPLWTAALANRINVLRRDLRTVIQDLKGQAPQPFSLRAPLPRHRHQAPPQTPPQTNLQLATRPVVIAAVERLTRDAVTLVLECPKGRPFAFHPGQFLTLVVPLPAGPAQRRAYSLCVAPGELPAQRVAVTVKRVAGGRVSNHLNDHARPGDRLEVLGPSGSFGLTPDPAQERDLVLIGGGSGVTPLMSIARAVLANEPRSRVALIYGNRAAADILFYDALRALAAQTPPHPELGPRFLLRLVLESPDPDGACAAGRLDSATCARELAALPPLRAPRGFLCGPPAMMAAARAALLQRGVADADISEERFSSPAQRQSQAAATRPLPLLIEARGRTLQARVEPGQTLLEAGLAAGAPLPYSCALGGCGACKVRLRGGAVVSEEPNCLSAAERAAGCVLACVSRLAEPEDGAAPAALELL